MGTTHVSEEGKVLGVLENRPIVSSVHDVYFWNMYSLDIAFFFVWGLNDNVENAFDQESIPCYTGTASENKARAKTFPL